MGFLRGRREKDEREGVNMALLVVGVRMLFCGGFAVTRNDDDLFY